MKKKKTRRAKKVSPVKSRNGKRSARVPKRNSTDKGSRNVSLLARDFRVRLVSPQGLVLLDVPVWNLILRDFFLAVDRCPLFIKGFTPKDCKLFLDGSEVPYPESE